MSVLQHAIELLLVAPTERRKTIITELDMDALHEAWRSCSDATQLARISALLLPRTTVARGLCECVRGPLSKMRFGASTLKNAIVAVEHWTSDQFSLEEVRAAFNAVESLPDPNEPEYSVFAAVLNLQKYLFADETEGLKGFFFFCVEATLSKDYPTWQRAEECIARSFREALVDPFEAPR
jgi:hypothetical protein